MKFKEIGWGANSQLHLMELEAEDRKNIDVHEVTSNIPL